MVPSIRRWTAQVLAAVGLVLLSFAVPTRPVRGQTLGTSSCGDGITEAGEQCDSGNPAGGACCDSACHFKVEGTECGSSLCDFGRCDSAGTCVASLRLGCRTTGVAVLAINDDTEPDPDDPVDVADAGDKVRWKWRKGPATRIEDYADPGRTTTLALCVYAGVSTTPRMAFSIPPSDSFWKTTVSHIHEGQVLGFTYRDGTGSADGVNSLLLRVGAQNKSNISFRASGPNLPDPPAGPLPFPVTVQLVNNTNNVCFQSVFGSAARNDANGFKAMTP